MSIEKNISTLLELNGDSYLSLSKKAKVCRTTLSRFLNHKSDMGIYKMCKVMKALNIDLEKILEEQIQMKVTKKFNKRVVNNDLCQLFWNLNKAGKRLILKEMTQDQKRKNTIETKTLIQRVKSYVYKVS